MGRLKNTQNDKKRREGMPERVHYDYYEVNGDTTISLFIDGSAMPFETISIDELLKKAGFDWERK